MLKIAVCDDEKIFLKEIASKISSFFKTSQIEIELYLFLNPKNFLESDVKEYDIIFLDVDMGECNGLDVARQVRKNTVDTTIIYISSFAQYAIEGYSVQAFQYLLKSNLEKTLENCLKEVVSRLPLNVKKFAVPLLEVDVLIKDIIYFESDNHSILLHENSGEVIKYNGKLSQTEIVLNSVGFLRVQKSFLVNMQYIAKVKNRTVILKNGEMINCSKQNYQEILQKYMLWKGEQ